MLARFVTLGFFLLTSGIAAAGAGKRAVVVKGHFIGGGASFIFPVSPTLGIETEINYASKSAAVPNKKEPVSELDVYSLWSSAKIYPLRLMFVQAGLGAQRVKKQASAEKSGRMNEPDVGFEATRFGLFAALGLERDLTRFNGFVGAELVGAFKPIAANFQNIETENFRMDESAENDFKAHIRQEPFTRFAILYVGLHLR